MHYVGRNKEIAKITRALASGKNVIIEGKFGIGRTSLARKIAGIKRHDLDFWFADFSQTPEKICRQLIAEMSPHPARERLLRYNFARKRIIEAGQANENKVIMVIDNIDSLSWARIDFLHYLTRREIFNYIAIVDESLKQDDKMMLRAVLQLVCPISLSYLSMADVREYFYHYSNRYHWGWSEEEIKRNSKLTRGYPLFMAERVSGCLAEQRNNLCS